MSFEASVSFVDFRFSEKCSVLMIRYLPTFHLKKYLEMPIFYFQQQVNTITQLIRLCAVRTPTHLPL